VAMVNLGLLLVKQGDHGEARHWYQQAAANGAVVSLGWRAEQNPEPAITSGWVAHAAEMSPPPEAAAEPASWTSPAYEGRHAAQMAKQPIAREPGQTGLPVRVPGANLLPRYEGRHADQMAKQPIAVETRQPVLPARGPEANLLPSPPGHGRRGSPEPTNEKADSEQEIGTKVRS
jgi:hypothetical protein